MFGKVFKTSLTSLNFLNTHFAILTLLDYPKVVWDDTMPEFVVVKRMGQITSNYTGNDKLTKVYTTFCEQDFLIAFLSRTEVGATPHQPRIHTTRLVASC